MIWFRCKQCGKLHGRDESSAGLLVFCECGQGNTVPWESTAEEPPLTESVPPVLPAPPRLNPVTIGEEPPAEDRPRRRRRTPEREYDRNYCLNHPELLREAVCAACGESFCGHCVVTLRDEKLCGPCKNLRLRKANQTPRLSLTAIFSVLLALMVAPSGLCIIPLELTEQAIMLIIFAAAVQLIALFMGVVALYWTERNPYLTGKSLAITGITIAVVDMLLMGTATAYNCVQWL